MHEAAWGGDADVMQLLPHYGGDLDRANKCGGGTPMHPATSKDHTGNTLNVSIYLNSVISR